MEGSTTVAWKKREVKAHLDQKIVDAEASTRRVRSDIGRTKARTRLATLREIRTDLFGSAE